MAKSTAVKFGATCTAALIISTTLVWAQSTTVQMRTYNEVKHDRSLPLRAIKPLQEAPGHVLHELGMRAHTVLQQNDPIVQKITLPQVSASLGLNFEGIGQGQYGFGVTSAPPDTSGAVGATQYVQWVNTSFAVFDKNTGALTYGPAAGNTLWSGFGGACQNNNDGDIIAQYDKMANRWVMSQLSVTAGPPFFECVAVSTTSDATGTYNRYAFSFANFDDYPKMGVWPDGYYMSFNMFNAAGTAFLGADACALNRAAMLAGTAATAICFQQNSSVFGLLPSDMDGTIQPPTGEPAFFLNFGTNSPLGLWKFHVDFTTPANSTFTGPTNLSVAAFTELCNGGTCVPQPGTKQTLDSLGDRLMYRLAWRKFTDGHESLVATHSVMSGIRWYEIQNPNGTPTVFQQGTFAPDANVRWMGSIAMDQAGDIALGYSASSATVHPSVFFTGRVPTDPLGTLESETAIVNGTGEQTAGLNRWGDYSAMTVDPVDDCTFWYTQEYMKSVGTFNWNTRIANFKFPGCGSANPVTFNPTSLSFPNQTINTTSSPMPILLSNNQNKNLTISNIATSAQFAVSSQNCGALPGAIVLPGGNCTIQITFTPTATGLQNGTLTVTDDAPGSQQTAGLSGTGTSAGAPQVNFSPTSLSYSIRLVNTTSSAKTVTLTNTGNATLNISNIAISGDFSISAKTCGSTLNANLSCTVSVKFTPTVGGKRTGSLTFTDNAAGNPQSVPLTGTGTIVSLSRTNINFGTITVGTASAPQSVTITNKGSVTLTFTSAAVIKGNNPGDYTISANTCGSTLAPNANCSISTTFKPTATGTRNASLNISDDGGGSPQKVSLTGTGQ